MQRFYIPFLFLLQLIRFYFSVGTNGSSVNDRTSNYYLTQSMPMRLKALSPMSFSILFYLNRFLRKVLKKVDTHKL